MSKINDILENEIIQSYNDGDTTVLAELISLMPLQQKFNALSDNIQKSITIDVRDIESGDIQQWSIDAILEEVNRDRNDEWIDYDYTDWVTGWDEWVDGEFYQLVL